MTKKVIIITLLGVIVGAVLGYTYYYFVGCSSGTCTITSKPLNSTLYGAILGGLLFNSILHYLKKNKT